MMSNNLYETLATIHDKIRKTYSEIKGKYYKYNISGNFEDGISILLAYKFHDPTDNKLGYSEKEFLVTMDFQYDISSERNVENTDDLNDKIEKLLSFAEEKLSSILLKNFSALQYGLQSWSINDKEIYLRFKKLNLQDCKDLIRLDLVISNLDKEAI